MRRSWLPSLLVLGGALLAGAPPGRALPPDPVVGRITALGGQKIHGIDNGRLLDRAFGPDCELPDAHVEPFAAALGDEVELDVQLIACQTAAPPEGRCRVRIGDAVSPWIDTRQGLKVPVPMPKLTGVHAAELQCESGRNELPALSTRLYLTYAPPRPIVDPPDRVWYERACTWGSGLSRYATERQVADQILHQLYQFGQRKWRYALCAHQGSECILDGVSIPTTGLLCFPEICKCPWTDLVLGHPQRNFTDCFIFSQVMQYIAATMGIGGMVPHLTLGSYRRGFVTQPTARALDPEFTGNLLCGEREAPCNYTFYNHELRKWGDLIYDATFGGIYRRTDELFSESVTEITPVSETFAHGGACVQGVGYGGFRRWVEVPKATDASCARVNRDGKHLVRFTKRPPSLHEPASGELVARVEVEILTQGAYVVAGGLYEKDGTTPVTLRSSQETVKAPTRTTVSGPPGKYPVDLIFSGDDVARSGYRGPYRLESWLASHDETALLGKLQKELGSGEILSPRRMARLGSNPARLGSPSDLRLEWVSRSGRHVLQATIPVYVRRGALYGYDARLSLGEQTLAYGGGQVELIEGGTTPLQFHFDFAELPPPETCLFALSLHWLQPPSSPSSPPAPSPLNYVLREVEIPPLPPPATGDSRRP